MKGLVLCVLVWVFVLLCSVSGMTWEENRHLWEEALEDKGHVRLLAGGDLTGNLISDVVVLYKAPSSLGLVALIYEGGSYKNVPFDRSQVEFLTKADLEKIEGMEIRQGSLYLYTSLDVSQIAENLQGEHRAVVEFRYLRGALQLVYLETTGEIHGQRAQLFYDRRTGQVLYRYLAKPQEVGSPMSLYFFSYARVLADPVGRLGLDGDKSKWVLKGQEYELTSHPLGGTVTWGYNDWLDRRDLSARYFVGHHKTDIYLYVEVVDDVFRQNHAGDALLRGDHIELWWRDTDGNRFQIAISPGNFSTLVPEARLWFQGNRAVTNHPLETVDIFSKKTDTGYVVEVRIPIQIFGVSSVEELTRFTLLLSDADRGDRQEKTLASSSLIWADEASLGQIIWR